MVRPSSQKHNPIFGVFTDVATAPALARHHAGAVRFCEGFQAMQMALDFEKRERDRAAARAAIETIDVPARRALLAVFELGDGGLIEATMEQLAARSGCSEGTMRHSVIRAERAGLLEVLRDGCGPSDYRIHWTRIFGGEHDVDTVPGDGAAAGQIGGLHSQGSRSGAPSR